MKKQIYLTIAISGVLLLLSSIFNSCIQEETFAKATVETSQVTSITEATATYGGIITADGGSDVTARGVCWSTLPTPTIENDTTIVASGNSAFTSSIKGLSPGTTYYVRAYAVNRGGVAYGLNAIFTTKTFSVTTTPISIFLLTATSAIGGGSIISNGDSSILTVKARGVCWNTFPTPTIENNKTLDGVGGGRFTSKMDSLTAFTTYYARAYATNGNGTIYGNEVSFTTLNGVVGMTTNAVSSITAYTANCGGSITTDGGATITERGLCWNTSPNPTTENIKTINVSETSTFIANITGLTPSTTYYVRTYAINSVGTSYGNEVNFITQSGVIGITTKTISSITPYTATSGGTITSDGGAPATERGICWNTSPSPTTANNKTANGSGTGTFTANITGLTPATTYYVRAYAINSVSTSYGNELIFTTLSSSVTDIDGNVYNIIAIGTQEWMVENLKTTHYRNGEAIPIVTDNAAWGGLKTGAYCNYDNNEDNAEKYGRLYNWYAVNDSRNIAPTGWHLPTDAEWTILTDFLTNNGYGYEGNGDDIAKSIAAKSGWKSCSTFGTVGNDQVSNNKSGFTAVPCGFRYEGGSLGFRYSDSYSVWWSSSLNGSSVWARRLCYDYLNIFRGSDVMSYGFSVRCVRDN